MSSVVISGDTSGAITLSAPAVAGTNTITLPAATGTVLTKNGSGIATNSTQPAFQVNAGSGGNQSFTSGTYSLVAFNTVVSDANSNFNTSTNRFVAPVAGTYYFYAQVYVRQNTGTNQITLYKNGSMFSYVAFQPYNLDATGQISCVVNLAANDYIQVYIYSTTASPIYYRGINETSFGGYLIG